eukprot:403369258
MVDDEKYYEGRCSICLETIQQKAKPEECQHIYCQSCILSWTRFSNVCPLCKVEITKIHFINEKDEMVGMHLINKPPSQNPYSEEQLLEDLFRNMAPHCYVCNKDDNERFLLLCDRCDYQLCHTYCCGMGEQIPDQEWFCQGCQDSIEAEVRLKQRLKHQKPKNNGNQKSFILEDLSQEEDLIDSEVYDELENESEEAEDKSNITQLLKQNTNLYKESDNEDSDNEINEIIQNLSSTDENNSPKLETPQSKENHQHIIKFDDKKLNQLYQELKQKSQKDSLPAKDKKMKSTKPRKPKNKVYSDNESIEDKLSVVKEDICTVPTRISKLRTIPKQKVSKSINNSEEECNNNHNKQQQKKKQKSIKQEKPQSQNTCLKENRKRKKLNRNFVDNENDQYQDRSLKNSIANNFSQIQNNFQISEQNHQQKSMLNLNSMSMFKSGSLLNSELPFFKTQAYGSQITVNFMQIEQKQLFEQYQQSQQKSVQIDEVAEELKKQQYEKMKQRMELEQSKGSEQILNR